MYHFAANRSIGTLIKSITARCHPFTATPSLLRTLTTDVSALDNDRRNLIKQPRERTSAPMKDVKASLEACSWDIEAAQRDLRKRGMVIASKKSARTAAEWCQSTIFTTV